MPKTFNIQQADGQQVNHQGDESPLLNSLNGNIPVLPQDAVFRANQHVQFKAC